MFSNLDYQRQSATDRQRTMLRRAGTRRLPRDIQQDGQSARSASRAASLPPQRLNASPN